MATKFHNHCGSLRVEQSRFERIRFYLLLLFATMIIASGLLGYFLLYGLAATSKFKQHKQPIESNTLCPETFPKQIEFINNHTYQDISPNGDAAWDALIPPNGGFIYKYDESMGRQRPYGVAMFHTLHCLSLIRTVVQRLLGTEDARNEMEKEGSSIEHYSNIPDYHWLHCLDYIRQAMLCYADDTVEPPIVIDEGNDGVSGMNVQRKCRDPAPLYTLIEESQKASDVLRS